VRSRLAHDAAELIETVRIEKGWDVDERVLLVEDDASIREVASLGLRGVGLGVETAADGRDALARFRTEPYDLVVLDIMLPELDGLEVCREIRRSSRVPILMLSARSDTVDIVVGLELGADDYVTKPFEMAELVARTRALLRRTYDPPADEVLRVGELEIEPDSFRATRDGVDLQLTATEFRLLLELARRPGRVFTRELLLERVWQYEYLGDSRLVDIAVQRLRAKVEADPAAPRLITTVRGVGYRLERTR
jgi:two-component system response regulator MtrA